MSSNACEHHLRRLARRGSVRDVREGGRHCWFHGRGVPDRALCRLRGPERLDVARLVLRRPGATLRELAQAAGLPPAGARRHLEALREAGLVRGVPDGRRIRHYPAAALEGALRGQSPAPLPGHPLAGGRPA